MCVHWPEAGRNRIIKSWNIREDVQFARHLAQSAVSIIKGTACAFHARKHVHNDKISSAFMHGYDLSAPTGTFHPVQQDSGTEKDVTVYHLEGIFLQSAKLTMKHKTTHILVGIEFQIKWNSPHDDTIPRDQNSRKRCHIGGREAHAPRRQLGHVVSRARRTSAANSL